MARIRSLKIGFFKNEHLAELSPWHRLLFEGLWLLADREGRLEDRPLRIKAELFPYDTIDVDPLLADLHAKDFIVRYECDGVKYLAVVFFTRHQRPKSDEAVSVIPAPTCGIPRGKDAGPRISPLGKDRETERQRTEDRETGADVAPPPAVDVCREIGEAWNTTTTEPIAPCQQITAKRRRHIKARFTERPLTEWREVFRRIEASPFCHGKNDRGWVASFDWAIGSADVAVKVLEGKYDDHKALQRAPGPAAVDWFEECKAVHGGDCGLDRHRHMTRMRMGKAS